MSAAKEINIEKLGIIAGNGALPVKLARDCTQQKIRPYIVGFKGQTDSALMEEHESFWTSLGAAGRIIAFFKQHDVKNLVLIGGIDRPPLRDLKPDLKGAKILGKIAYRMMGDNALLSALKAELEAEGFRVHPIQDFCDDLGMPEGPVGQHTPNEEDLQQLEVGLTASQQLGLADLGQAVVVQNGTVIGQEDKKGTNALIDRCATLQTEGRGGVLVKTCKPQQDKALDMPTIGVETVEHAHKAGLVGIFAQAENVILIDPKTVAERADQYNMFVVGVSVDNPNGGGS